MSKRNIYLLTIGIITIICIIAGSIIHLNNFNIWGFDFDEEGDFSDYQLLEDFQNVKIDGKVLGVKVVGGDEAGIKINCNKEKLIPDVYVEGSDLIIEQNNTGRLHGTSNCAIILTIPDYMTLKELEIEINVGEIDISDISSDYIDVTTNVGELKFENILFQELEGESNVGEITLEYPEFSDVLGDFNISLSTNVGEVTVNDEKFKKSYNQKGSTSKKVELSTNVGEIKIK